MDARNLRVRSARDKARRPRQHGWGKGFRRGATLARRFFGAPVRVLRSPVRVLRLRRGIAGSTAHGTSHAAAVRVLEATSPDRQPVTAHLLTGDRSLPRRIRFVLVNLCTLTSIGLGASAVFVALSGKLDIGAVLLLGCVFFDGLDGSLARAWKVSSPFGAQMDSLADMCSFGMATPLLAYLWLEPTAPNYLVGAACILMGCCAAVRLARFNISPKDGAFFSGVPTTMAAGIVVLFVLVLRGPMPVVPELGIVALSLLMVSNFPYVKLQRFFGFPMWLWSIPVIAGYFNLAAGVGTIVATYLLSGPWASLR
ncbi:MAG: CDP-alcohol phosphatidyltransferase family protein, partial [Mycobacteriales bacterium]